MNLYVGNLDRDLTENELKEQFTPFGQVTSVTIIRDRNGGQSRGFGFVEMPLKEEAESAIVGLKGKTLLDRTLDITEAVPRRGGKSGGKKSGGFSGGRRH